MKNLFNNNLMKQRTKKMLKPDAWGLRANSDGELMIGGCSAVELAEIYGTPLHVFNEKHLRSTALNFVNSFSNRYPGKVSVHYAFKCNSVPAIVSIIKKSGLNAEVMSEYELKLALDLDYKGENIIVNGPYKPDSLLKLCLDNKVRLIIVDSLAELDDLIKLCNQYDKKANILLRINPDYVPRGMNQGSATGSRKGCAFGLDLKGSEVYQALSKLAKSDLVYFQGFQFHIGTGISDPLDYEKALKRLKHLVDYTVSLGFGIRIFDIGGGIATPASREMTTLEMLIYQGWERLPAMNKSATQFLFTDFADAVTEGLLYLFKSANLPELIIEPGRCIASSSQLLLLGIYQVKNRPGMKKWIITDGGIGTVTMPTFYEYHEVFLCNDLKRPRTEQVTITGPVCFAADIVYRNKKMPVLHRGEILAIMDSGAYFTAWESSFGFPHPAVISVSEGHHWLLRRRETYEDMVARDGIIHTGSAFEASACFHR
jgi:diaminopimelate decarboxylase